jgi:hypothetical protein
MFDQMVLESVIGLMVLANRLVEAFVTPIFEKFGWDKFWILYIAWVVSGAFVFPTGLNLFSEIIPSPLFGQILTAIVAGGGANLLHNLTDIE